MGSLCSLRAEKTEEQEQTFEAVHEQATREIVEVREKIAVCSEQIGIWLQRNFESNLSGE